MTNLTLLSPNSSYGDVLTTTNGGNGLTNVLKQLQDGLGNPSTITIATNAVNFNRQGGNTFQLDGISLNALSVDINNMCQPNPICSGTGALLLPRGTTAQRPANPVDGMIRYNTDDGAVEFYENGAWE